MGVNRSSLRCLLTAALAVVSLGLAGCLLPQPYRVSSAGATTPPQLRIEGPNVYRTSGGVVSILYFPAVVTDGSCQIRAGAGGLLARRAQAQRGGRTVTAVRFEDRGGTFASRAALSAAIDEWWLSPDTTQFRDCFNLDQASVRRSLLAQRPQSAAELLDAQFAFDGGADTQRLRTVLLRPGMRICATDGIPEENDRSPRYYQPLSANCTRLVGAPEGGVLFDPVAGRFGGLTHPNHGYQAIHRVASWGEIQRPQRDPHLWALVLPQCPQCLPVSYEVADPDNPEPDYKYPLLVGIRLDKEGSSPPEVPDLLGSSTKLPHRRVEGLCAKDRVICYRFGSRTTFTTDFPVYVNGAAQDVGVGTTIGDMAAIASPDLFSQTLFSPAAIASTIDEAARDRVHLGLSRLKMQRVIDGRLVNVDLSAAGVAAYALPLQPGDRLTW